MLRLMQLESRENPSGPSLVDPLAPPPPSTTPPVVTPPDVPPPDVPPSPPSGTTPGLDLIDPLNPNTP